MAKKLKTTLYAFILCFLTVSILPINASAKCPLKKVIIIDPVSCQITAKKKRLRLGGNGFNFIGKYETKGCYAYNRGKYKGMAFFSVGGKKASLYANPGPSKYRLSYSEKYPYPGVGPSGSAKTWVWSGTNGKIGIKATIKGRWWKGGKKNKMSGPLFGWPKICKYPTLYPSQKIITVKQCRKIIWRDSRYGRGSGGLVNETLWGRELMLIAASGSVPLAYVNYRVWGTVRGMVITSGKDARCYLYSMNGNSKN